MIKDNYKDGQLNTLLEKFKKRKKYNFLLL